MFSNARALLSIGLLVIGVFFAHSHQAWAECSGVVTISTAIRDQYNESRLCSFTVTSGLGIYNAGRIATMNNTVQQSQTNSEFKSQNFL